MSVPNPQTTARRGDLWKDPLADSSYLRLRLSPPIWNIDYLPLRDLLAVVGRLAQTAEGPVFDYGCGGAPYRHLFAHCPEYIAADIVAGPHVDVVLPPGGLTNEPAESFRTVFSSQVLEHVPEPSAYLAEAFRILAPGGSLILTTHGMFLEHGCPDDYYRWTGFGLAKIVREAGFEVSEVLKISPGARASAHLMHTAVANFRPDRPGMLQSLSTGLRKVYGGAVRWLINSLAVRLESRTDVPGDDPTPVYIGVGVLARKPPSAR